MLLGMLACQGEDPPRTESADREMAGRPGSPPPILANNAFYYYEDLDGATKFYTETLGLETVSDFGFAKIMRVASASYLTLVEADSGMHSTDEPKAVTLALVTDEVEEWYAYLTSAGVPMRAELRPESGRPHDGFVAIDPEGYFLEFERFNPHPENERLTPMLNEISAIYPAGGESNRPSDLGIAATVLWLYYDDLAPIQRFYEDALDLTMIVDQGWAKVYPSSPTGFIGLVDGSRGLHAATEDKAVTVSFFTDDVDGWFDHMRQQDRFEFRTDEIGDESGRVRVFVGYDPGGYFLEWDTFLESEEDERLLRLLRGN